MKFKAMLFSGLIAISVQAEEYPKWLQQKITQLQSQAVENPPASIFQYHLNGEIVYYFPAKCCDQMSQLVDQQGQLLCRPDGGFTGRGDGKCPKVSRNLKDPLIIWQDPRK